MIRIKVQNRTKAVLAPKSGLLPKAFVFALGVLLVYEPHFNCMIEVNAQTGESLSLEALKNRALEGDPRTQCELGLLYSIGMDFKYGLRVITNGVEATKWFRMAADKGDADGQSYLGDSYACGTGVAKDSGEAIKWYLKCAEQGNHRGQFSSGMSYVFGLGVTTNYVDGAKWLRPIAEGTDTLYCSDAQAALGKVYMDGGYGLCKDTTEATKWCQMSAGNGNSTAMYLLGDMYEFGRGVEKNYAQAINWYRKADESGWHATARHRLGCLYESGQGVGQDFAEAAKWYRKAAKGGNADSCLALGCFYEQGQGVERDYVEAYAWVNLAASAGCPSARTKLDALERKLQTTQILEAQKRTKEIKKELQASPN